MVKKNQEYNFIHPLYLLASFLLRNFDDFFLIVEIY